MNAAKPSAASQAAARSALKRAASHAKADHSRLSLEDYECKAKALVEDLQRGLDARVNATDFDAVSGAVLSAPGVEAGFIQQTAHLDKNNVVRVPGGAGAWIHGNVYRDGYRVFIQSSGKHYEAQNADLMTAVREAFAALKIELPKGLVE